jgi:hypothetical protein
VAENGMPVWSAVAVTVNFGSLIGAMVVPGSIVAIFGPLLPSKFIEELLAEIVPFDFKLFARTVLFGLMVRLVEKALVPVTVKSDPTFAAA